MGITNCGTVLEEFHIPECGICNKEYELQTTVIDEKTKYCMGEYKPSCNCKKNTVTQEQITKIMESSVFDVKTIYGKVTVVTAKLPNGFTIVESSACVDPANYVEAIGVEICKKRIENELWQLEGYLLQENLYRKGVL